ncbi:MAG: hypothetical protein ACK41E_07785 [Deinococcales bacterium]
MQYTPKFARRIFAVILAFLALGFATLPSSVVHAEDGGKINTGG